MTDNINDQTNSTTHNSSEVNPIPNTTGDDINVSNIQTSQILQDNHPNDPVNDVSKNQEQEVPEKVSSEIITNTQTNPSPSDNQESVAIDDASNQKDKEEIKIEENLDSNVNTEQNKNTEDGPLVENISNEKPEINNVSSNLEHQNIQEEKKIDLTDTKVEQPNPETQTEKKIENIDTSVSIQEEKKPETPQVEKNESQNTENPNNLKENSHSHTNQGNINDTNQSSTIPSVDISQTQDNSNKQVGDNLPNDVKPNTVDDKVKNEKSDQSKDQEKQQVLILNEEYNRLLSQKNKSIETFKVDTEKALVEFEKVVIYNHRL